MSSDSPPRPPYLPAILTDLGAVPVVSLDWFLSNLLPESDLNVDDVLIQLLSTGDWEGESGRWSAFPADPGASDLAEDLAFQGFQQVVEAIVDAISRPRINTYSFQPGGVPASERDDHSQPDGFFTVADAAAHNQASNEFSKWWDIFCPTEFKKSGNTVKFAFKDAGKIVWSMHQIMRVDARRRFTFGISIEDTRTRLWFACRSVVLVSKPFNFMTEPEPLIEMVNFLTCASPEQLGYDTTMRRIRDCAGQEQFVIDIGDRKFQTDKLLAAASAEWILGHGTRVWRGSFQDAPGTPAVLKDCWVERDRRPEGDILATLRDEYSKLGDSAEHTFDDYFMKVIAHGWTTLTGGAEDDTQAMVGGETPFTSEHLNVTDRTDDYERLRQQECWSSSRRARSSAMRLDRRVIRPTVRHAITWRCHYRISFDGVATPLYKVVNLQDHMTALRDAMIGIEILHQLGYVHRDISSGNILFHGGRGRLSDLEYCKPFSEVSADCEPIGTVEFMSVEVGVAKRLFAPLHGYGHDSEGNDAVSESDGGSEDNSESDNGGSSGGGGGGDVTATIVRKPPFQYFFLHDFESMWWLLTFALFCNGVEGEPSDKARENLQIINAQDMFPRSLISALRRDSFASPERFVEMKDSLPSILHPLFDIAESLRCRLTKGYQIAEWTGILNQADVPRTLSYFRRKLDETIPLSQGITLVPGLKFERKRPATSSTESDAGARKVPKNV